MSNMDEKKIRIDLMRWCATHQSRMDGELCLESLYNLCRAESLYEDEWVPVGWEPCKAVWVEKPIPVEVSDE